MTTRTPVIDTCVHHRWKSATEADILEYLPRGWREYVGTPGSLRFGGGARPTVPAHGWRNPMGDEKPDAFPEDGTSPGSSLELLDEQVLTPDSVERALLLHDRAMFAPAASNVYLVSPFCRALNDWTIDQWLSRDARLFGAVVANTQLPVEGAAEIRRAGQHPKMAAVIVAASPSGHFFGHPEYFPILEAACELDLPLVIHRGGDSLYETPTEPAGGSPFTFAEYMTTSPLPIISQMTSLIAGGAFERYPSLRVYLVGGGVTWISGAVRRANITWRAFRAEVPWVRKTPGEYFREHFRVSTYGIEHGAAEPMVRAYLELNPDLRDLLVYGSGYPSWDTTQAPEIERLLPDDWSAAVLADNAAGFFRWDGGGLDVAAVAQADLAEADLG